MRTVAWPSGLFIDTSGAADDPPMSEGKLRLAKSDLEARSTSQTVHPRPVTNTKPSPSCASEALNAIHPSQLVTVTVKNQIGRMQADSDALWAIKPAFLWPLAHLSAPAEMPVKQISNSHSGRNLKLKQSSQIRQNKPPKIAPNRLAKGESGSSTSRATPLRRAFDGSSNVIPNPRVDRPWFQMGWVRTEYPPWPL